MDCSAPNVVNDGHATCTAVSEQRRSSLCLSIPRSHALSCWLSFAERFGFAVPARTAAQRRPHGLCRLRPARRRHLQRIWRRVPRLRRHPGSQRYTWAVCMLTMSSGTRSSAFFRFLKTHSRLRVISDARTMCQACPVGLGPRDNRVGCRACSGTDFSQVGVCSKSKTTNFCTTE